jgi:hypothetical protein
MWQAKGNAILQASLERRKQALHDRRLALEQDVRIFNTFVLIAKLEFLDHPGLARVVI